MGSKTEETAHIPWIRTPCLESAALSRAAGCRIFLKHEQLQPSGSFKSRGIGNHMLRSLAFHNSKSPETPIHFYCSSGGNAGLACAHAALALNRPATIVVPMSASEFMVGKLRILGVKVFQKGETWFEADTWMREDLMGKGKDGVEEVYVSPFDHEWVWEGAAGMVEEMVQDLGEFDAIICSVGGGGMFNGIMEGVSKMKSPKKPVVLAMETVGADCLNVSLQKGENTRLPGITSVALSLGATKASEQTWKLAQDSKRVISRVLPDKDAIDACVRFADEERILVEPACGVSLALAYQGKLKEALESAEEVGKLSDEEWKSRKVVVVVCGGSNITTDILEDYRKRFA